MANNEKNLTKLLNYVNKFTLGVQFKNERLDILNKFGNFYDILQNNSPFWTLNSKTEVNSKLINLFDYYNTEEKYGTFFSTTRFGFNFDNLDSTNDLKNECESKLNSLDYLLETIILQFEILKINRIGLYFEIPIPENCISIFKNIKLFSMICGNDISIEKYETLNLKYSMLANEIDEENYERVLISLSKVMPVNSRDKTPVYLLTSDFQLYFPSKELNSVSKIKDYFIEKFNSLFKSQYEYLLFLTENKESI